METIFFYFEIWVENQGIQYISNIFKLIQRISLIYEFRTHNFSYGNHVSLQLDQKQIIEN